MAKKFFLACLVAVAIGAVAGFAMPADAIPAAAAIGY
jgi:hypothetical protein